MTYINCPYCGAEMQRGYLVGFSARPVLWAPEGVTMTERGIDAAVLEKKSIEKAGGIFLDRLLGRLLISKERPVCCYCKDCDVFLVKPLH